MKKVFGHQLPAYCHAPEINYRFWIRVVCARQSTVDQKLTTDGSPNNI